MAEIVVMPKLELTMEEGVIVQWNKKVGDSIKKEEILCSIETEKSVMEMESPSSGILLKIWGKVGERYPVTTPIAIIGEENEDIEALIAKVEGALSGKIKEEKINAVSPITAPNIEESRVRVKMMPRVRKLVQELNIDLAALASFYGDKRISEEDVYAFQKSLPHSISKKFTIATGDRRVHMSTMRRTIATNMTESCQKTARLTNITEVDMTKAISKIHSSKEEKISLSALVVKACALAIQEFDIVNTIVDGDDIIYKAEINIGVAVDIPIGLVVPVIHQANTKNLLALTREIETFAEKASAGSLSKDEMSGGTFTVTNIGMLAVTSFTPIINYPQTAIMGVGSIRRMPRYLDDDTEKIEPRNIMNLCLSYDHRVIDGAPAARFSMFVRNLLENPDVLFQG